MISEQTLTEIKKFNQNIEWLKKNHQSVPSEIPSEWIDLKEVKKIIDRGRTWLKSRMIHAESASQPINYNWFLVYGLDWRREGSRIMFKRTSIIRLKDEVLVAMGNQYENSLQ